LADDIVIKIKEEKRKQRLKTKPLLRGFAGFDFPFISYPLDLKLSEKKCCF
jgi:hypothetical protein